MAGECNNCGRNGPTADVLMVPLEEGRATEITIVMPSHEVTAPECGIRLCLACRLDVAVAVTDALRNRAALAEMERRAANG